MYHMGGSLWMDGLDGPAWGEVPTIHMYGWMDGLTTIASLSLVPSAAQVTSAREAGSLHLAKWARRLEIRGASDKGREGYQLRGYQLRSHGGLRAAVPLENVENCPTPLKRALWSNAAKQLQCSCCGGAIGERFKQCERSELLNEALTV